VKIIGPKVDLLIPRNRAEGIDCLQLIEHMARVSHRSEAAQTSSSWEPFYKAVVVAHGDWSVVEHAFATVEFRVNRGVTHEQVRHRLFSPTQESTRFCNYGKTKEGKIMYEAEYIHSCKVKEEDLEEWIADFGVSDAIYLKWLNRGYAPQIARDHLNHALAATIGITGNLRQWRHALIMRTTNETHPDFRLVMTQLLAQFQARVPLIFDDVIPNRKQSQAIAIAR
jgi:thymidylate synthase (FAD)